MLEHSDIAICIIRNVEFTQEAGGRYSGVPASVGGYCVILASQGWQQTGGVALRCSSRAPRQQTSRGTDRDDGLQSRKSHEIGSPLFLQEA